jgi:hypothetical protein
MGRTNEPLYTSGSHAKEEAASYLVLRYAGASGPATIPMAGPAPEALARRGPRLCLAVRPGRAGGATLSRAAVLQPLPSQALLPAGALPRRSMPRQDEDGTRGRNVSAWPCHIGSPSWRATTHRFIPWHAPGAQLPGLVGRTCCRPGHERSSRRASPVGRRRRCWTGPRPSVERRPAQQTSAARPRRPRAEWSRTCRPRLAGGGRGSALPVPARVGAWRRATAGRRGRGGGW